MHDVACECARAIVRSKDAQKQLARTSLNGLNNSCERKRVHDIAQRTVTVLF